MWKEIREQLSAIISREIYRRENHAYDEAAEAIAASCHCQNPHCCAKEAAAKVFQLQHRLPYRRDPLD